MGFFSTFALELIKGEIAEQKNPEISEIDDEESLEVEEQAIYGY